ncbi:Fc.00g032530.m01.CDS01 [Cosmosporella sp. VM-42]
MEPEPNGQYTPRISWSTKEAVTGSDRTSRPPILPGSALSQAAGSSRANSSTEETRKRKSSPSRGQVQQLSDSAGAHKVRRLDTCDTTDSIQGQGPEDVQSQKDWRQIVCDALRVPHNSPDDVLKTRLKNAVNPIDSTEFPPPDSPAPIPPPEPFYKIVHRVHCGVGGLGITKSVYMDKPVLHTSDDIAIPSHILGNDKVLDLNRHVERNIGMSFLVIREYRCCDKNLIINPEDRLSSSCENLIFSSSELCSALGYLRSIVPNGSKHVEEFTPGKEHRGLYYWLIHHREELLRTSETETGENRKQMKCFIDYLHQHKGSEFQEISLRFEKREVTRKMLRYLLIPEEVCVYQRPQGREHYQGVRILSWPNINTTWLANRNGAQKEGHVISTSIEMEVSAWEFDGNFKKVSWKHPYSIQWGVNSVMPLSRLHIYPFRYADKTIQNMIQERGKMVWSCRFHNYISYTGWDFHNQELFSKSRFVVDRRAYKHAERRSRPKDSVPDDFPDDLGQEHMDRDTPPGNEFLLLLPANSLAEALLVSRMSNIHWDEEAFHRLVLPADTKDVIKALVTHRISRSISTDLIGVSVAEHAKKPLYRITCGDIGTESQAVERYLNQALRLAKTWDCVVLLDEAEVFLQERSLTDLQRNALVSVFLRVLEYYDGILILTSNRVGTLDEGFKSRIQLALEYPKLDSDSRRTIWENFLERLDSDPAVTSELDISDLRRNLANLAKYELNGREIRNAINVARPLAMSSKTRIDFTCLKKVIGVQRRFDQYIKDMNEGLDDEKVAREEGKR